MNEVTRQGNRGPAEVFPPGDYIRRELEARNWTQADLADVIGRPLQVVNEVVAGKRSITPETAKGLAEAFATSAELWMNLDAAYQLSRTEGPGRDVAVRARLYARFPIRELQTRAWITRSHDADALTRDVIRFYGLATLDEEPKLYAHAARKTSYGGVTPEQEAWLFRAIKLARTIQPTSKFSTRSLDEAIGRLCDALPSPKGLSGVPFVLAAAGIRFLILEALPRTRIDGACFWLSDDEPVVVVSFRYDRIDYFWHTLMHELGHVARGDGRDNDNVGLDTDIVGVQSATPRAKPDFENHADNFAVSALIPQDELDAFIARTRPFYSRAKILAFADRLDIHAGILVGQLQYRGEILFSHSRDLLVKVRDLIIPTALTDGWGRVPAGN